MSAAPLPGKSAPPVLPSHRVIAAALRNATELLAGELRAPGTSAPRWSEFEWSVARAVSAMHGITALLARRLRWRGPVHWQQFLDEQREQARARDAKIADLLERLAVVTRDAGIPVIPLKGAALRPLDLYAPGERPMGDIDLLADAHHIDALATAFATFGYAESGNLVRHRVFMRSDAMGAMPVGYGENADNALPIEVHPRIAERLPYSFVDITGRLYPDTTHAGFNEYRSRAALMAHLLLHAAGNMRAHALRLVQLLDMRLLGERMSTEDWDELCAQRSWWALPALVLAERYFEPFVPARTLATLRDLTPRWLAHRAARLTLTEVSWSNLRIAAFPGIEWARTPMEAWRFALSRARPSPGAVQELSVALKHLPALRRVPWYQLDHSKRILRWIFSHPPRVQTLVSVQAALEQSRQTTIA